MPNYTNKKLENLKEYTGFLIGVEILTGGKIYEIRSCY